MARRPRRTNMTLIKDARSKHITFSKRRSSIFKRASELCTLCAVEMALIIFSPGGKPYSFGHPSTEAVLNRLIAGRSPTDPNSSSSSSERVQREAATMAELNKQLSDLNAELKEEEKRGKELKKKMKNLPDVEKMNREELMKLKEKLEALRVKLHNHKEELLAANLTLGGVYSSAGGEASSSSAKTDHRHQADDRHEGENFSANNDNMDGCDLSLGLSAFVPK